MNTALGDASALNHLLDEYNDDWSAVLPAFSKERVKEGRALTDLAYNLFSHDTSQQVRMVIANAIRNKLSKILPFVWNDPQFYIGQGEKLSVVYDRATKMGIIPAVRRTNDSIRQAFFEEQVGMVKKEPSGGLSSRKVLAVVTLAAGAAYLFLSRGGGTEQLV